MTHSSLSDNDPNLDVLRRFLEDLHAATEPAKVVADYRGRYPELADQFSGLAEVDAALQEKVPDPWCTRAGDKGDSQRFAARGERLGPYRVDRVIGRGGMGEVFEAVEESLGRRVAVKTIRGGRNTHPDWMQRFLHEREVLARLHHTHIVPIFAAGQEGDLLYFAMPYIPGASLGQVIQTAQRTESRTPGHMSSTFEDLVARARNGGKPATTAATLTDPPAALSAPAPVIEVRADYIRSIAQIMAAVSEALHHAHEAKIIHRDLKPSNIMVEPNGHPWVLDFGLARVRPGPDGPNPGHAPALPPRVAITLGPVGTPPYMAPEQYRSGREVDARTDVWGLGVTLYELLTLHMAFKGREEVLGSEPVRPRALVKNLPRDLEAIVLKALKKDPNARYATALEQAEDLRRWLEGKPVAARPARTARRVLYWSRRNKGSAAAIATVVLAGISIGVLGTLMERNRALAAEASARAKARQLQLLDIQRIRLGDHEQGWSRTTWDRLALMELKPDERAALQAQAVATLAGLDTQTEKEFPFYAQVLDFAPDGRLRLGHTGEGSKLWDPETDRLESRDLEESGPLAIRRDGTAWQLGPSYTGPDRPGRIPLNPRPNPGFPLRLLDVDRQAIVRTFDDPVEGGSRLLAWTLAPQGSHAAAVVNREGRQYLVVWDADTGRLLRRIDCPNAPESPALPGAGLAFAPDASLLATWDGSGRIDLWGVPDGQALARFSARNPVNCVAFGPNHWLREAPRTAADRWMLAAGDVDGFITLFNPGMPGAGHILKGRSINILSLAFSPDGTLLASAGRIPGELWDVATGRRLIEFVSSDYATALAFSLDGSRLASSNWAPFVPSPDKSPRTRIFKLEPGRGIRQLHGLPGAIAKAVFSRDGRRVAALSWDWWAGVWDRDTGRLLRICAAPRGPSADNADLVFSPDGRRLAVSAGNTATLWDIETGAARRWTLPWALGETLLFAGPDRLLLMRVETHDGSRPPGSELPPMEYPRLCVLRDLLGPTPTTPLKVITDFNWSVHDIKAAPDGSLFVIDGRSGPGKPHLRRSVRVYDPEGKFVSELSGHNLSLELTWGTLRFDPTGKFLVMEPSPNVGVLLDMPSGRFLGTVPARAHGVSPGARWWAQVDDRYDLHLCDRAGNRLVEQLSDSGHFPNNVPFSPDLDGRYLLWGDQSGLVSVADLVEVQRRLAEVGLR
jgi:serine/threonine protein kinase/WD40 repeat protein